MNPLALDPLSPIGDTYRATGPLALDPLSPEHTRERHDMKIVVIGGSGLIGSKLVTTLTHRDPSFPGLGTGRGTHPDATTPMRAER